MLGSKRTNRTKAALIVAAIAIAASLMNANAIHVVQTKATSLTYRTSTAITALYQLITIDPKQLEPFFQSFDIWNRDGASTASDFEKGLPHKQFCVNQADADIVVDYYGILNRLCALGNVEKMYIPPIMKPNLGVFDNQLLYERSFAHKLHVGKGHHLLELGCGRGRITHHIATQTGATITAINIEPDQLSAAINFAASQNMNGTQLNFLQGNYNDPLPFEDNAFDGLYQVQAFTYAWDLNKLFAEIARVLKPGSMISILDGVMLDGYDPSNATHRRLLYETRQVTGLGGFWHYKYWLHALTSNGFTIIESEVKGGHQFPLIDRERWLFENAAKVVDFLDRFHLLPPHVNRLIKRFTQHGESFTTMDREDMFTTSYAIIARLDK